MMPSPIYIQVIDNTRGDRLTFDAADNMFVIEASDIRIRPGEPMPREIQVVDRDGTFAFRYRETRRNDGDVIAWIYAAVDGGPVTLHVLND